MIIIKLSNKIKYISQIQYNKIVFSLNFNHLQCPNCHSNGLIIHAYYDRHVDIVRELIARPQHPAPRVSLNPEVTNFYDFTTDDLIVEGYEHGPQIKNIPIAV